MPSPIPDEKGQPSLTLHRYGVGVDCHSRFFQVCVLIPDGTQIVKTERKVPALWPESCREGLDLGNIEGTWPRRVPIGPPLHLRVDGPVPHAAVPGLERAPSDHQSVRHQPCPAKDRPPGRGEARPAQPARLVARILDGSGRDSGTASAGQPAFQTGGGCSRLTNRINSDLLRFGHTVGQLGKINGPVVRALIEDFCANGSVSIHRDHFSDTRIPAGVILVFDQRWKRIDALDQEIKLIEELCIKQTDALTWRIGAGRTASGCQLRSNLQSIPGVGTQTVTTWLGEVGDITRFASVNKLLAYAGLDPTDQISAGKVTGTKTRKGNARLHAHCGTRRERCSVVPRRASSRCGRGYMGRHSRASKSKATRALRGGSARRCTIAISKMNPLMTRVTMPC